MTMTTLNNNEDTKLCQGKTPTEVVEELAGSKKPLEAAMARLIATGVTETFDNWLWAEYERGTQPVDIITAYLNLNISLMARLAITCIIPGGEASLVQAMQDYDAHLPEIINQYRNPVADSGTPIPVVKKGKSPWLTPES